MVVTGAGWLGRGRPKAWEGGKEKVLRGVGEEEKGVERGRARRKAGKEGREGRKQRGEEIDGKGTEGENKGKRSKRG